MATARQVEVLRLHREACIVNGHPQTSFLHRKPEGVLSAVAGFPNNTDYAQPGPRSSDNPADAPVAIWATWQPIRTRGGGQDGGDTPAMRFWAGKSECQFPAIDDNFNLINVQDDDFVTDPQGYRWNVENPILSPDGSFWTAVMDRVR